MNKRKRTVKRRFNAKKSARKEKKWKSRLGCYSKNIGISILNAIGLKIIEFIIDRLCDLLITCI